MEMKKILISACLLGVSCRWNGKDNRNDDVLDLIGKAILVPVCPEQLGGLSTPRARQEIQGGSGEDVFTDRAKVITENGENVTAQFVKGAEETLKIARIFQADAFIGKSFSPSCSVSEIYDGTFSGKTMKGRGTAAALLMRCGIAVRSEEEI